MPSRPRFRMSARAAGHQEHHRRHGDGHRGNAGQDPAGRFGQCRHRIRCRRAGHRPQADPRWDAQDDRETEGDDAEDPAEEVAQPAVDLGWIAADDDEHAHAEDGQRGDEQHDQRRPRDDDQALAAGPPSRPAGLMTPGSSAT